MSEHSDAIDRLEASIELPDDPDERAVVTEHFAESIEFLIPSPSSESCA